MLSLGTEIIFTTYLYIKVHRELGPMFDVTSIIKYIFVGTIVIFLTGLLNEQFILYDENLINHLVNWIPILILGACCFIGINYIIDKKSRDLVNAIIKEIKNIVK